MLTKTAVYEIETDGFKREITITPLFLQNHTETWQPNEIFDLSQEGTLLYGEVEKFPQPENLGKIIVDDQKNWHYEGESDLSEEHIEEIAQYVLSAESE